MMWSSSIFRNKELSSRALAAIFLFESKRRQLPKLRKPIKLLGSPSYASRKARDKRSGKWSRWSSWWDLSSPRPKGIQNYKSDMRLDSDCLCTNKPAWCLSKLLDRIVNPPPVTSHHADHLQNLGVRLCSRCALGCVGQILCCWTAIKYWKIRILMKKRKGRLESTKRLLKKRSDSSPTLRGIFARQRGFTRRGIVDAQASQLLEPLETKLVPGFGPIGSIGWHEYPPLALTMCT